jgi:hypothetical protein
MPALIVRCPAGTGPGAPAVPDAKAFSRPPRARQWPSALRAAAAALAILFIPTPAAAQVIRGRVVDAQSGAGVPMARVVVTGVSRRYTRRMFTAADGRFAFPLRRGGSFQVRVTRAGYGEARTRSLGVGPNDTVDVDVPVTAAAHRLDPVTVTARARRLRVIGVYDEISEFPYTRVSAAGLTRSVGARGWFPTPDFCYHLAGNAERTGSVITLTVQARATGELCEAGTGSLFYNVTVRRLPPGVYTFRVLHAFRDDVAPPVMALDTTITVQ